MADVSRLRMLSPYYSQDALAYLAEMVSRMDATFGPWLTMPEALALMHILLFEEFAFADGFANDMIVDYQRAARVACCLLCDEPASADELVSNHHGLQFYDHSIAHYRLADEMMQRIVATPGLTSRYGYKPQYVPLSGSQ